MIEFKKINGQLCIMLEKPKIEGGKVILGYPVEDGSAEWALYQMQQGRWVKYEDNFHPHSLCRKTGRIVFHGKDEDIYQGHQRKWLNKRKGKGYSWQLYEPNTASKKGNPNPDDNDSNLCGACAGALKTERERLLAEIAKLKEEKYYYAAQMLDKYSEYMCPPDTCGKERTNPGYCDGDNSDCTRCWHEFLMKEEK